MSERINTGNYQACMDKTGIQGSKKILLKGDLAQVQAHLANLTKQLGYNYYIEEEVFYRDTMKDENGKDIDTTPGYVRMH